jgi:hypothetical protein
MWNKLNVKKGAASAMARSDVAAVRLPSSGVLQIEVM